MSTTDKTQPETALPLSFGIIVFPGFQALDAFGPLDALNTLARIHPASLTLSIVAASLSPVSTTPTDPSIPCSNPSFAQSILPTHTYTTAPPLDVLIVPGGIGTLDPSIQLAVDYIQAVYPSLKYLITVCSGSVVVAKAGVLDGRRATTNKMQWDACVKVRPQVEWVKKARWVVDGNVWTSSGVSAGLDVTFAWIGEVFGEERAEMVARILEYERRTDPNEDPFANLAQVWF